MHESLVFISDDLKHDSHLVHHFVTLANTHLQDERGLKIKREVHISDGAASQYKSRTPFADVACSNEDYGFPVEKHFFGSRHGKGPSDGETGVVKTSASIAVKSRKAVIMSATSMFEYCVGNLTTPVQENEDACFHQRRKFFFVPKESVNHVRPERVPATLPGTRSLHATRFVSRNTIATRNISCFCESCILCLPDTECVNSMHVDQWVVKRLKMPVNNHVENVLLQHPQPPRAQPKQQPKNKTTM